MSLKDYIRGYVDCRNDQDNLFTRRVYEGLLECVGLHKGKFDYDRYDKALSLLEKGDLPSASFAIFERYLIQNKAEIDKLWDGKDKVDEWLADLHDVAKYLGKGHSIADDINKVFNTIGGPNANCYVETDKLSGKQYFHFTYNEMKEIMFKNAVHSVKTKDESGRSLPEDKQEHKYRSEMYKIWGYRDYIYQVYAKHPEVIEKIMKEGNLAELNIVFNNKLDIDYANKTSAFSNCDRFFEHGDKEKGLLTTIMIAYQDVNERITMELLNRNYNLDLIMNPNAAHESKINGRSGADADFKENGGNNFLELQTKLLKQDSYEKYDTSKIIYKASKNKSFNKYIDEGKQVYHMEKVMNVEKYDGYPNLNSDYLKQHYTIYDINAIEREVAKFPECRDASTYATYNAVATDVDKLEQLSGKTLKLEVDKMEELARELNAIIAKYMEQAMEKTPSKIIPLSKEVEPEKSKTLEEKINAAKNKQVVKTTTEHKKERERE